MIHAETLENAIKRAAAVAQPGDIVLLAPACASFDQFRNYEHRGQGVQGDREGVGGGELRACFRHGVPKRITAKLQAGGTAVIRSQSPGTKTINN